MKKTGRKYIAKTFINIIIILAMSLSFTTNSYASSEDKIRVAASGSTRKYAVTSEDSIADTIDAIKKYIKTRKEDGKDINILVEVKEELKDKWDSAFNYNKTYDGESLTKYVKTTSPTTSNTTSGTSGNLGKMGEIYTPDASVTGIGQKILWLVQIICYAAAFIILLLKGVKFMKSAPEAKADVKKELVAYSIGAFILFGVGTLVTIIANIAIDNIN